MQNQMPGIIIMEDFKYLIPEESIDAIITNVEKLREIENHLRHVFSRYGYNEVLMPSFEYVDLYTQLDTGFEPDKMFQYINHEGKNVAMRVDFTIPLARLYANSHSDKEARYSYFGKVYRKEMMHKGRSSEFFQGGVELMNKPGLEGDKEIMTMIQACMPFLSLKHTIIEIGSAKFFNRLLALAGEHRDELITILKYRKISSMKKFVSENQFDDSFAELLLKLPTCFGDIHLLEQIIACIKDPVLYEALTDLKKLYDSLENQKGIIFDLGMVPTMKYYTGLMIKGYSDQSASLIISGGRYDKLLPRFQVDSGAIGFCFHMNHILKAIEKEGEDND